MRGRLLRPLAALSCVLGVALAAPPLMAQTSQRVPVDQASTEQKARFVEMLVTRSVSASTIETSGDPGARDKLARARALVGEAKDDLSRGQAQDANEKLDEALRLVNVEARRLSQSDVKEARQKDEYDRRHNAVKIFLGAYERVAEQKQLSAVAAGQLTEIRALVGKAEGLASAGRLSDANQVLEEAYRMARGDIREMREGATLTRSLNFETAEEEYKYEHDRNDSHFMLLQFAINEKKPPASRITQIDRLKDAATGLRGDAERQARSGEHAAAIGTIVRSTDTLLKAIRMSGVWVPG